MIHETAIVDKNAEIDPSVEIGPYSIIGPDVKIGKGTVIGSSVRIEGDTKIGENNKIFHGAVIGLAPQDYAFKGEKSGVIIGDNNIIREYASIHRATGAGNYTIVGDNNFIMAYAHIAHNCKIGSNIIIVNAAQLAGHVVVEDFAYISGLVGVHQFVRIGRYSLIGANSKLVQDLPPFVIAQGVSAKATGINIVGLKRKGFDYSRIRVIKEIYRIFFRSNLNTNEAIEKIMNEFPDSPDAREFVEFVRNSKRGVLKKSDE